MKILSMLFVLMFAGCSAQPVQISTAPDTRNCATIEQELKQVKADIVDLAPKAAKADESNREIRGSFMSYVLIGIPFLKYDGATPARFENLKTRKNALELSLTSKNCSI